MTEEPDLINRLVTDNSLVRLSRGYVVDLWVYDDHFASAKPIKVSTLSILMRCNNIASISFGKIKR